MSGGRSEARIAGPQAVVVTGRARIYRPKEGGGGQQEWAQVQDLQGVKCLEEGGGGGWQRIVGR